MARRLRPQGVTFCPSWQLGGRLLLVVLVIFLFLRSIRSTLVPIVTIPIALIGGFAILQLFGFDHHRLTHKFKGLNVRLTDQGGKVVKKLLV